MFPTSTDSDDFEVANKTFRLHSSTLTRQRRKRKKPCQAVAIQQSQGQDLCQSAELRAFVQSACTEFFGPSCALSAFKQQPAARSALKPAAKKKVSVFTKVFLTFAEMTPFPPSPRRKLGLPSAGGGRGDHEELQDVQEARSS